MSSRDRSLIALAIVLLLVGLVSRAAPLADAGGRMFQQFPTEDGYLMLTIARNIALGRGMSTAEGTLPTNGTQPLATLVWAGAFRAVDADRYAGVWLVQLLEIAIACAAALLLFRMARRLFEPAPWARAGAALAAGAWFASPMSVRHSMNCLESGLYALVVLSVASVIARGRSGSGAALGRWLGIGVLLGLAFLARNDGVLLCVAVGLPHLFGALPAWRAPLRDRFLELCVAGTATLAVALPWLVHNQVRFGSVVPISGQAESLTATFAQNLAEIPAKLFEYLTLYLPLPGAWETAPVAIALCTLFIAAASVGIARATPRFTPEQRTLAIVGAAYAVLLAGFYGLFFGAGHFVSRYLFPTSVFSVLIWTALAVAAWNHLEHAARPALRLALRGAALVSVAALAIGLSARMYANGDRHAHFQVVEWAARNVPDDVWVAAIQTGTLGFFHERTINLDGKVNPEALEARKAKRVPRYVVEGPIQYLIDWSVMAEWSEFPDLQGHFDLIEHDDAANLAVLARRGAPRRTAIEDR